MATAASDRAELRTEKALLLKADADIEDGWRRLRGQQDLLLDLQAGGHDTTEAERLLHLMEATLVEWERHRTLIEQRVAYLEKKL